MAHRLSRISLLLLAGIATACATAGCTRSSPVRYYLLNPAAESVRDAAPAQSAGQLLIEPVALPRYLDRPQLLINHSAHEVRLLEYHRWAEPLKDGLARTLTEDLAALLPEWQVVSSSTAVRSEVDLALRVRIIRLYAGDGEVLLAAEWQARAQEDGVVSIPARRAIYTEKAKHDDPSQLVAAVDRCVLALAKEIAAVLASKGTQ